MADAGHRSQSPISGRQTSRFAENPPEWRPQAAPEARRVAFEEWVARQSEDFRARVEAKHRRATGADF